MKLLRGLIVALAALATVSTAQAQSTCASIVYGAVLTAAQWNKCFTDKQDLLGYTAVNKAGDAMAGRLSTFASTASRAGFAIFPGVAPSAPNDGDMWVTSFGIFVRVNGSTVGPLSATGSSVPSVVQGDLLYGSGVGAISTLGKNTSATRYLANSGTSNNPAWAQVDLTNGVSGLLPGSSIATNTVANSNLAQGAAWSLKGNPTSAFANEQDFGISGLVANSTPSGSDLLLLQQSSDGSFKKTTITNALSASVSTPQITALTTGSGTYTTPAGATYLKIKMVGGGGGGAGSGTSPGNGGAAGNSTLGAGLTAHGGAGGGGATGGSPVGGGSGNLVIAGQLGGNGSGAATTAGGAGGGTPFGKGGIGGAAGGGVGGPGVPNTGGGGGGGAVASTVNGGGGGGSGEYIETIVTTPAATYAYSIGSGGTAGGAGTGGVSGGAGGTGLIVIEVHFGS